MSIELQDLKDNLLVEILSRSERISTRHNINTIMKNKTWDFRDDPCSMQVYLLLLMSPLKQYFHPVTDDEADKYSLYGCDTWDDLCSHATQWAHDNADTEEFTLLQSARYELKSWLHDCCGIEWSELNKDFKIVVSSTSDTKYLGKPAMDSFVFHCASHYFQMAREKQQSTNNK